MTNGEKYTTTEERVTAFRKFCRIQKRCDMCLASRVRSKSKSEICFGFDWCALAWIVLEAENAKPKEEELKPCPFCGSAAVLQKRVYGFARVGFFAKCTNGECEIAQDFTSQTKEGAIADWNRRVQ